MHVFLSHAAEDARIASSIKQLIERCSLGSATVWFSSDTSPTGGVTPGGPWFDQLLEKMEASSEFLALITPTSVTNTWLHYEAGCAATKKLSIIPIVAGLSVNDVRAPLSLYNAYNVSQPEGLKNVVMRLFQKHSIAYDPDMLETPIQHAVREIESSLSRDTDEVTTAGSFDTDSVLRLIDRRFIDLINALPVRASGARGIPTFSVSAAVTRNKKLLKKVSVDISDDDSIQDVANAIYFQIEKLVAPYKYLEQWVVRDNTLGVNLIMRDFLEHVKANSVIQPGHAYEIILLSHPYDPTKGDFQSLN